MTDTPKTPREFVEAMLRSCVEADWLASGHINNPPLRRAESQAAVNGFVAAMAMSYLRIHARARADKLAEFLDHVLSSGTLGIAAYRVATALDYDHGAWTAQVNERIKENQQRDREETDLRTALTRLATRYEEIAEKATTDVGRRRAMQIQQMAADIRHVLDTTRIPGHLINGQDLKAEGGAA